MTQLADDVLDSELEDPGQSEEERGTEAESSGEFDPSALPLEAQEYLTAKQRAMQADYTRKTQRVAAERREMQSKTSDYAWVERLNSIAERDPQEAARLLHYAADQYSGRTGGNAGSQSAEDEPDEAEMTPTERFLYRQNRSLAETVKELRTSSQSTAQSVQEERQKAADERFAADLKAVDTQAETDGIQLDRDALLEHASTEGISNLMAAYRNLHHEDLLARAAARGPAMHRRREAASIVPSGGSPRAPRRDFTPKTMAEAWEEAERVVGERARAPEWGMT